MDLSLDLFTNSPQFNVSRDTSVNENLLSFPFDEIENLNDVSFTSRNTGEDEDALFFLASAQQQMPTGCNYIGISDLDRSIGEQLSGSIDFSNFVIPESVNEQISSLLGENGICRIYVPGSQLISPASNVLLTKRTLPPRQKVKVRNKTQDYKEQINIVRALMPIRYLQDYCLRESIMILNRVTPFKVYLKYRKEFAIFLGASVTSKNKLEFNFLWGDKDNHIFNSPAVAQRMKETLFIYGLWDNSKEAYNPYTIREDLEKFRNQKRFNTNGYTDLLYKTAGNILSRGTTFDQEMALFYNENFVDDYEGDKIPLEQLLTYQARALVALPGAASSAFMDENRNFTSLSNASIALLFEPSSFFLPERITGDPYIIMKEQFDEFERKRLSNLATNRITNAPPFDNRIVLEDI